MQNNQVKIGDLVTVESYSGIFRVIDVKVRYMSGGYVSFIQDEHSIEYSSLTTVVQAYDEFGSAKGEYREKKIDVLLLQPALPYVKKLLTKYKAANKSLNKLNGFLQEIL